MAGEYRCDDCGKFISIAKSWAAIYDIPGCQLDHIHSRCIGCHEKLGPAESNARPHDGNMAPYQGQIGR